MDDRTRSVVIALLAIIAIAIVAATIESTVVPDASGSGPGIVGGESGEGFSPPPQPETTPGETLQIPFLSEILTILAALVLVALLVYAYRHWRTALAFVAAFVVVIVLIYLLVSNIEAIPEPPMSPERGGGNGSFLGGGGGGETGEQTQPSLPSILLLFILGGALVATIAAYVKSSSSSSEDEDEEETDTAIDTSAVGAAAGRAADRLESQSDFDNEVYRAWREMTDLLSVPDPETSTPAEFATAAVEAGMRREDVDELTRLFEDVRYGDQEPSPDREARAVEIFRRIEDYYTDDEGSEAS